MKDNRSNLGEPNSLQWKATVPKSKTKGRNSTFYEKAVAH